MDDGDLIDKQLTVREARQIFVHVNLDDELYEQEDSNNSASELVFDEFQEVRHDVTSCSHSARTS